ncbi:MAG: sulfotransferase [Bacteroidales bacterium]
MSSSKIIKSSNYGHRPWWFSLLNRAWEWSYPLGTKQELTKDRLIGAARRLTGEQNLGADFWDEPLDRLLYSIREEAGLHPIGYFITRQRMINLLAARLRAEALFRRYPEILDQPLLPAWVILGLQRTGTTKLHRLLAADRNNRVVLSWEAINPATLGDRKGKPDRRIAIARTSERALRLMAPGFFAIHPVEHNAPEEDILLLDMTFLSTTPEATMNVPSYAAWLEKTDQSMAYAYLVKLLKLLQWQRPGKRWILKSPHHLEFTDLIDKHFGDVHFLWTHREVTECVPSFISMMAHSRVIFSKEVNGNAIARHWIRKTGYMLQKGLEYRQNHPEKNQFTDIFYPELKENAQMILQDIYRNNGGMTPELLQQFMKAEKANPMGKYGIHEYLLEDFGAGKEEILEHTQAYRNFFDRID